MRRGASTSANATGIASCDGERRQTHGDRVGVRGQAVELSNDVVVRRDGHVYFSDPASDAVLDPGSSASTASTTSPPKAISFVAKMARPNSVALTPDGKMLYVADTQQRKVMAYDLDAQGNASESGCSLAASTADRTDYGSRPMAIFTLLPGIPIYTPDRKFVKMIEFPETPANYAFRDQITTLYVTARTSVTAFAFRTRRIAILKPDKPGTGPDYLTPIAFQRFMRGSQKQSAR